MLVVSEETVRRWIRTKELQAESFGKSYRVQENSLNDFLIKRGIAVDGITFPDTEIEDEINRDQITPEKSSLDFGEGELNPLDEVNGETNEELPEFPRTLNTSEHNLIRNFYEPCFKWATKYDRAVGYFTSNWLKVNANGMTFFASNDGKARWITSPILDAKDAEVFKNSVNKLEQQEKFSDIAAKNFEVIKEMLEKDTLNALCWMIYDGILEFRFAIAVNELEDGDFHDKFGIFSDEKGNKVSFNGSVNDSYKGTVNYESIKTFTTWEGMGAFVEDDEHRFERLWENTDKNVKIYELPEAIKKDIFALRQQDRPYKRKSKIGGKWRHQEEAIEKFLEVGNGILEMATGTGKTKTAISIVNILLKRNKINNIIVTVNGTDLLDQWYKQLLKETELDVFRYYASHKELPTFMLAPENTALLVSRDPEFLYDTLTKLGSDVLDKSLIICDEVHGLGSPALVSRLKDKIKPIKYRLGLSATPEREYDDAGNEFILNEIGDTIFQFDIKEAIKRGILCEFEYTPLEFQLSDEDKSKIKKLIGAFYAKKKAGEVVSEEYLYTQLALVKKVSQSKIPVFRDFLKHHPEIFKRSIIFVETKEFGLEIQDIIINATPDFHTYYGEDDRRNLLRFSKGEINCLMTSKRISEGIDIQSVNNIILFSADKANLQTIQRIGRSLRIDPSNPSKRAHIVDFICTDHGTEQDDKLDEEELNTDEKRSLWLQSIAGVKREEN